MAKLDPFVVRFKKPDGKIAGTGFLVSTRYIVTCTHVLWTANGNNESQYTKGFPENEEFKAELPFTNLQQPIKLKVIKSLGLDNNASYDSIDDISLLEIIHPNFESSMPLIKFPDVEACRDHGFFSKGFHVKQGAEFKGTCASSIDNGRVQLDITSETKGLYGASGSPVWIKEIEGIGGMLQSIPQGNNQKVYMIPMRTIYEFSRGLDIFPEFETRASIDIPDSIDNFKQWLTEKIQIELESMEDTPFILQLSTHSQCKSNQSRLNAIAKKLLDEKPNKAIRNYLRKAAADCVKKSGRCYNQVQDQINEIKNCSSRILGWILISSINEQNLQTINPENTYSNSLYFKIDVQTLTGVEIVISRRFNHISKWEERPGVRQKSPHCIQPLETELKWDEDETSRKLSIEVWNQVFTSVEDKKEANADLTELEVEILNATLEDRRTHEDNPEHYYIAFESNKAASGYSKQIYNQFLNHLSQMTVVEYGKKASNDLFITPEPLLITAINEFYREINE